MMDRYKLRLTETADRDLDRIEAWLESLEFANTKRTLSRIADAFAMLARRDVGRPGQIAGTREFSVPNAPYVIVYVVKDHDIEVVSVFHTAQNR